MSMYCCFRPSWNTWKQRILHFLLQIVHLQTSHCIRKRSELSLQTSAGKVYNGSGLTATTFARMGTIVRLYFFYNIFVAKLVVTPTKDYVSFDCITSIGQYPFFTRFWPLLSQWIITYVNAYHSSIANSRDLNLTFATNLAIDISDWKSANCIT